MPVMMRTIAFAFLLLFQAAQTTPPADAAKKALDQIQGSWQAVSLNGQNLPNGMEMTLSFSGDKYENWVNGALDERGTVKTQLGLVEVNGDSLILSFATPGNPTRPKTPSDAELYAVLRKKK